jgi:hypothetical protein
MTKIIKTLAMVALSTIAAIIGLSLFFLCFYLAH